jgi:hypothetical protein
MLSPAVLPEHTLLILLLCLLVMGTNFVYWLFEFLSEKKLAHFVLMIVYILLYVAVASLLAELQPPPLQPIPTLEVIQYEQPKEPKW